MQLDATQVKRLEEFASQQLQIEFKDIDLLREALTHKSYSNEVKPLEVSHNERLEFLGDAVLELAITEYLFNKFPNRPEGDLTSFRAALVRKESLAETASQFKYGEYLFMSRGEEQTGGRKRAYILANSYESVLGAIYLEAGFEASRDFVKRSLLPKLDNIVKNRLDIDPKSKFQELAQDIVRLTPTYELVGSTGPDHNKVFVMGLMLGKHKVSEGQGRSKQDAEQSAAADALENWPQILKEFFGK